MDHHSKHMHHQHEMAPHHQHNTGNEEHHHHSEKNHGGHEGHSVADFRFRFWISLVITIPIVILSPMLQHWAGLGESLRFPGDALLLFGLSTFLFFYGGRPFLKGMISELRARKPGMMTLVAVAISTAFAYGTATVFGLRGEAFFWETATLIDIMLLGHWIEMKSVMGASMALEELARLLPADAHKLMPDGSTRDVPLKELHPGDRVLVKPGERVPADGLITGGESSLDESMLTGESVPVHRMPGSQVIGGSINGDGSIIVEVQKTGKDSFLSQVIHLVKEAQRSKSKTQVLANRAAMWLTLVALAGGAITLFVWAFIVSADFAFALERTVTVMVIACPHALGLAIPLVVAVSTALSATHGFLIKNRIAFEQARGVQVVIFDKTGTLTEGKFGVAKVLSFLPAHNEEQILNYAASVEAHSEHPIAKSIHKSAKGPMPVEGFKAMPGKGAEGIVNAKKIQVVSLPYLKDQGLEVGHTIPERLSASGETMVFVVIDGKLAGAISLSDIIRPDAKMAIDTLRSMGIKSIMLTGDNKSVAHAVASSLGIEEYFAEVLPEQKAMKVKEVQARGLVVAMTGDGVNDAPALAQADVGIGIGAGTDVAIAAADIVLVRSNPMDVVSVIKLAKATYAKMVQNLAWAAGYNVLAMPLAAGVLYAFGVLLSPAAGAVLMSISTVVVAINAQLLKTRFPNVR